jgi:hypothetical protein
MKTSAILMTVLAVSACDLPMGQVRINPTNSATTLSLPVIVSGNCGASGLQYLLNQPETALNGVTLPGNTRIIRPGMSFERNADRTRLNIGISAAGNIVHMACG